jgi:hypothetical protein
VVKEIRIKTNGGDELLLVFRPVQAVKLAGAV